MKLSRYLDVLLVLLFLQLPLSGQTLPPWVTVIPAQQQAKALTVTLPVGTSYRFLSVNGKATVALIATAAPISDWDTGIGTAPPDPEPGVSKAFQVAQPAAPGLVAIITDNSVTPAKVSSFSILALAPPVYAPITFATGSVYTFLISNVPPVTGGMPQFFLEIMDGPTTVKAVCTYTKMLLIAPAPPSTAPAAQKAVMQCKIQPPTS